MDDPERKPVRHLISVLVAETMSHLAPAIVTEIFVGSLLFNLQSEVNRFKIKFVGIYENPFPLIVSKVPPPVPPLNGEILSIFGVRLNLYSNWRVMVEPFSLITNSHTVSALFTELTGTFFYI